MERKVLQVGLVALGLAATTGVHAQERAAFAELGRIVKPGQTLVVRDNEGRAVQGKLVSVSGRDIVIARPRTFRRPEEQTFQAGSVSRISRADSRVEGALIGLGVGLAAAGVIASTNEWNPDVGAPGAFMVYGVLLGSLGAGLGTVVDGAFKPTIYESSKPGPSVRIAPLVRGGRRGILASVRF